MVTTGVGADVGKGRRRVQLGGHVIQRGPNATADLDLYFEAVLVFDGLHRTCIVEAAFGQCSGGGRLVATCPGRLAGRTAARGDDRKDNRRTERVNA